MGRAIGEFGEYLAAFWPAWWSLFAAGALYGFDEVLAHRFPKAKGWLDRQVSASTRRVVEYSLIVLAVFYAGFAAWQVEHRARLDAQQERARAPMGARALTAHARSVLAQNRQVILAWKHRLFIVMGTEGDTLDYAWQFYEELQSLGANVVMPQPSVCRLSERGVLIGVKHPEQPSREAKQWEATLLEAGVRPVFTRWHMPDFPDELDFNLFICPAN